jgi:hypothetical protein
MFRLFYNLQSGEDLVKKIVVRKHVSIPVGCVGRNHVKLSDVIVSTHLAADSADLPTCRKSG